jgi:hypothetical protein
MTSGELFALLAFARVAVGCGDDLPGPRKTAS